MGQGTGQEAWQYAVVRPRAKGFKLKAESERKREMRQLNRLGLLNCVKILK